jgi:Flp pilus assembly protein TadD
MAMQIWSHGWLALGAALLALGCGGGAEKQLEEIRNQQEAGKFAVTLEPLRELLQASPDDPELNHLYGSALLALEQPDLAIWSLRKAALKPERAIDDGILLAVALLRGGSADDAVEQVLRVLELAPDNEEARSLLMLARTKANQHEEILEDTADLLAQSPDDQRVLMARAVALLGLNRADEAGPAIAARAAAVVD